MRHPPRPERDGFQQSFSNGRPFFFSLSLLFFLSGGSLSLLHFFFYFKGSPQRNIPLFLFRLLRLHLYQQEEMRGEKFPFFCASLSLSRSQSIHFSFSFFFFRFSKTFKYLIRIPPLFPRSLNHLTNNPLLFLPLFWLTSKCLVRFNSNDISFSPSEKQINKTTGATKMFSFPLYKIEEMPKSNGVLAGINHSGIDTKSKVTDMPREARTRKRSSQKSRKRWTLSIPVPTSLRLTFQSTSCTYELSLHFSFSFWVLSCWCFFMNANMSSWKRIKSTANNNNKTITCSNHWRVHKWSSPARCSRTYSIVIHFLVIRFVLLSLSHSLSLRLR